LATTRRRPPVRPLSNGGGDDLAFVVQVIDLGELPAEAAREAVAVEPQPDEGRDTDDDAVKTRPFDPNDRDRVAEPSSLRKFLTLEEHGDAGSRKDHGGGQRRTCLRVTTPWGHSGLLLRHARLARSPLVVGFAVDTRSKASSLYR